TLPLKTSSILAIPSLLTTLYILYCFDTPFMSSMSLTYNVLDSLAFLPCLLSFMPSASVATPQASAILYTSPNVALISPFSILTCLSMPLHVSDTICCLDIPFFSLTVENNVSGILTPSLVIFLDSLVDLIQWFILI